MHGRPDSEGLIPVEQYPPQTTPSPISPMTTGNGSYSTPPAEMSNLPAAPPYERTPAEQAPMPVQEKSYQGQPIQPEIQPAGSQYPMSAEDVKAYPGQQPIHMQSVGGEFPASTDSKAYPGQPMPAQIQPQAYYTPYGQPTGYATAVPLHALQSAPCPVDCPSCGQREITRIQAVSGASTHGWAAVLCCCLCLGCIPYMITSLKDVEHSCGKCGVKLACWHNSGRVQVFQTESRPRPGVPPQLEQKGKAAEGNAQAPKK